jgi:GxxExxY protein
MRRFTSETSPETHAIIGAAIEVQRHLGSGMLESAYADALEVELADRSVDHRREVPLPITYKGRVLRTVYRADFICGKGVLVELKAASALTNVDLAQVGHYLAVTGLTTALLLNFGHAPLQIRRFVNGLMDPVSADSVDSAVGPAA